MSLLPLLNHCNTILLKGCSGRCKEPEFKEERFVIKWGRGLLARVELIYGGFDCTCMGSLITIGFMASANQLKSPWKLYGHLNAITLWHRFVAGNQYTLPRCFYAAKAEIHAGTHKTRRQRNKKQLHVLLTRAICEHTRLVSLVARHVYM